MGPQRRCRALPVAALLAVLAVAGCSASSGGTAATSVAGPGSAPDLNPVVPSTAPAPRAAGATATPTPDPRIDIRQYKVGHCYTWDQTVANTPATDVPCAGVHLFEAVGHADLSRDYPQTHAYPSPAEWIGIEDHYCGPLAARSSCAPTVAAFLHRPSVSAATLAGHPGARLGVGYIGGNASSWRLGSHGVACLVDFWDSPDHQVSWSGPPTLAA